MAIVLPDFYEQAADYHKWPPCPCGGCLVRWGFARPRVVEGVDELITPPRARCSVCRVTHVLLPSTVLLRRRFSAAVIGEVLECAGCGWGARRIAKAFFLSVWTVRRWLRAARANSPVAVAGLVRLVKRLEPGSETVTRSTSPVAALAEWAGRLAGAMARSARVPGVRELAWRVASWATMGRMLAPRPMLA